jgi:hypothetical protein
MIIYQLFRFIIQSYNNKSFFKGKIELNLTINQLLTILSAIGWANYFWWDHFVWLSRIGE